jgi:hypothetical protein
MLTCAERAGKPIPEKDPDLLSVDVHITDQNVQITPDGKTKVRIKVTCDNVPVKDAEVEVTVKPMDGSGGHYHDASKRLRGKLNGTDCGDLTNSNYCVKRQTGEDGELTDSKNEKGLTFAPPGKTPRSRCVGLAGVYEVTAKSTRFPDRKAVGVITVKYDNLTLKLVTDTDSGSGIPIDPANPRTIVGSYYKIRSVTDAHPYGPYGTTTTVSAFQGVAKDFYQLQVDHNAVLKQCGHLAGWDPPKKVSFNDIALPGGGLFDLGPSDKDPVHPWWQPGHQTHGKGGGGDFNHFYQTSTLRECNGTDRNFDAWLWSNLKALGKKYGGQWDQDDLNKGNLWHLHIDDAGVKRPEKCPDDD